MWRNKVNCSGNITYSVICSSSELNFSFVVILSTVESWSDQANSWGFQKFVPFSDLKDTSKGLLVNDTLKIEVEFEDFSKTKYFPS